MLMVAVVALWGARELARAQAPPVHWKTVVIHEPPPVPVVTTPIGTPSPASPTRAISP